jgi:hypothetical protein
VVKAVVEHKWHQFGLHKTKRAMMVYAVLLCIHVTYTLLLHGEDGSLSLSELGGTAEGAASIVMECVALSLLMYHLVTQELRQVEEGIFS